MGRLQDSNYQQMKKRPIKVHILPQTSCLQYAISSLNSGCGAQCGFFEKIYRTSAPSFMATGEVLRRQTRRVERDLKEMADGCGTG